MNKVSFSKHAKAAQVNALRLGVRPAAYTRARKALTALTTAMIVAFLSSAAMAASVGAPFDNIQPSLVVTELTPLAGIFPSISGSGSAEGDTLGFVYDFAGNFALGDTAQAQGQTLSISQNTALFSILGTIYGGNGTTNFNLPNLTGQAIMGTGGSAPPLGEAVGSATVSLTTSQLPAVQNQQPFNNVQPSLPLNALIATNGIFPSQSGGSGSATFIGQIANFAGNFAPSGWAFANGQLLPIAGNQALFSIIGTTYGGNGTTTFALPNLQGRVAVGADSTIPLGTPFGQASTLLTPAQISGAPVSNYQASLAVNYLIATAGIFPSSNGGFGFNSSTPVLGQITEFAGNFAPSGWAFANGQLLPIAGNQALFSVIGTTYGGNGVTDFALPNLDGRTIIGDGYYLGEDVGINPIYLTAANIPTSPVSSVVPEPKSYAMWLAGLGLIGFNIYRRKSGSPKILMAA